MSGKKQRDAAAEEAARQEQKKSEKGGQDQDAGESKDILGDEDNEDVIF